MRGVALDELNHQYAVGSSIGVSFWNGSWHSIGSSTFDTCYCILLNSSTDLYVGGSFTTIAGVSANKVAHWNGVHWSAVGTGPDTNNTVLCLAKDYLGNIYAGGDITGGIKKWTGSSWVSLDSGVNGVVRSIVCDSLNNVYVTGDFTDASGLMVKNIAKWDGVQWRGMYGPTSYGLNSTGYAITIDSLNNLYVGGSFNGVGNIISNCIIKSAGINWYSLNTPFIGTCYTLKFEVS